MPAKTSGLGTATYDIYFKHKFGGLEVTSQIIAMLAAAGLMTAGVSAASGTRSSAALPVAMLAQGASGGSCSINVIRTGTPGTADVTRETLKDGSCVCNVTTGPSNINGSAESIVSSLLSDRECPGARAIGDLGETAGAAAGGNSGTVLAVLVGTVGAGGLVVALKKNTPG